MKDKTNFNLYIWTRNRADFAEIKNPTRLLNRLLAGYIEKQRQIAEETAQQAVSAADRDGS